MSDIKWYGDGIYSRTRQRRGGEPREVFYGQVWVPSQKRLRHFKLGTTLRQAKAKMRKIQGDPEAAIVARKAAKVTARPLLFSEFAKQFLAHYRSRGGTDYYHSKIGMLEKRLGPLVVSNIDRTAIDRYLESRRGERWRDGSRRMSESTLRKEVTVLGTMLRWGKRRGLVRENPVTDYEKPNDPGQRPIVYLSEEQEAVLLPQLPPWARDVVMWAIDTGMRRGEILNLVHSDIDRPSRMIHVRAGKTGTTRQIPLDISSRLTAILDRRPRHVRSDLVFCQRDGDPLNKDLLNSMLVHAMRGAAVPKADGVLWNLFRHTFGTRLARKGTSPFLISKLIGNSVRVCERHYMAFDPSWLGDMAGALDHVQSTRATADATVTQIQVVDAEPVSRVK